MSPAKKATASRALPGKVVPPPADTSKDSLLAYFDRILPLGEKERALVEAKFSPRLFRRRQYVLQEGNQCSHFYFVVRGCLRMYKIDEAGDSISCSSRRKTTGSTT